MTLEYTGPKIDGVKEWLDQLSAALVYEEGFLENAQIKLMTYGSVCIRYKHEDDKVKITVDKNFHSG